MTEEQKRGTPGSFDILGFVETTVMDLQEFQSRKYEGWQVIRVLEYDEVVPVDRSMAYVPQGQSYASSHNYTTKEVMRRVSFVVGKNVQAMENAAVQEAERQRLEAVREREERYKFERELEEKKRAFSKLEEEKRKVERELSEEQRRSAEAVKRAGTLYEEHEKLKKGLLATVVKLPGGNELPLLDAITTVKATEILMDKEL